MNPGITEVEQASRVGRRVRTNDLSKPSNSWTAEALVDRRVFSEGEIVEHHNSHGECYGVRHSDGALRFYDPHELEFVDGVPSPQLDKLLGDAEPEAYRGYSITPVHNVHSTPVVKFKTHIKGQRLVYTARSAEEARKIIDGLNQKAADDLRAQIREHIEAGHFSLADVLGPSDVQMQWDDEDVWKEIPDSLVMPKVNPFAPVEDQIRQAEVCMEASLRDDPTNHRAYFRGRP